MLTKVDIIVHLCTPQTVSVIDIIYLIGNFTLLDYTSNWIELNPNSVNSFLYVFNQQMLDSNIHSILFIYIHGCLWKMYVIFQNMLLTNFHWYVIYTKLALVWEMTWCGGAHLVPSHFDKQWWIYAAWMQYGCRCDFWNTYCDLTLPQRLQMLRFTHDIHVNPINFWNQWQIWH